MKKSVLLVSVFISIFVVFMFSFSLTIVSADFSLGKLAGANGSIIGYDINDEYGSRGILSGMINLSISNEVYNSLLSVEFNGKDKDEVTIKEFLDLNNMDYSCTTESCGAEYETSGSGASSKTINLNAGESKLIGFKIVGSQISLIEPDSFSLKISSTASSSCTLPLKINIGNKGFYDWVAHESTTQKCSVDNNGYGCYTKEDRTSYSNVIATPYCTNIDVPIAPKLFVGGNLTAIATPSSAEFKVEVDYEDGRYEMCKFSISNSGEAGCIVNASIIKEQTIRVCLSSAEDIYENKYKVGKEIISPCGEDSGGNPADYSIFAIPMQYSAISDFDLTSELAYNLNDLLENSIEGSMEFYLDEVYRGDCTNGCIIPINLSSGISQTVTLSNLGFIYDAGDPETIVNGELYELSSGVSIINMGYNKLDLSKAGLIVPKNYGNYDVKLALNGAEILTTKIKVLEVPVVELLYPQKVPAGIDVVFMAYVSGGNITKYSWDFGGNLSKQETSENKIVHKYQNLGTYTVTITAENSNGLSSPASFNVNVVSPQQYMDEVFKESQDNINSIRTKINSYPAWIKNYFITKLELDKKESELKKLKTEYEGVGGAVSSYVDILNSLEVLNIPSDIIKRNQGSVQFLVDQELVDSSVLESLGAGTPKPGVNYKGAVFEWFTKSMTVLAEVESYFIIVDRMEQPFASKINLVITPQIVLDDIYFVVTKAIADVLFEDGSVTPKSVGTSTGIIFSSLENNKQVNFIVLGEVGILDIPVYFSPSLSKLSSVGGLISEECNNNNVCETGETWKTCRNDCKPWGWILFWLLILFLIAFAVYIALQEWYKRRYESHLFKDKNELFNLINFMDNAEKQGISKDEIFKKLREKGWEDEKIKYAWRKYRGMRTGLWEVPLFKFVEKIQVKKEVEKRRQQGQTGKIIPIPGAKGPSKILQVTSGQPQKSKMQNLQEPPKTGFAKFWDKYGIKIKKKQDANALVNSQKSSIQNQNINKPTTFLKKNGPNGQKN